MNRRARLLGAFLSCAVALGGVACDVEPGTDSADATEVAGGGALLTASYDTWKQRFSQLATAWQDKDDRVVVGRLPLPVDGEDLGIDYILVPATETPTNLIIMNSGIHGVEAPAGVAFQDVLLSECVGQPGFDRSNTSVLVLHAMNASGAKHGRRFNHNNVDLNRNFFDAESNGGESFRGHSIENDEYVDVRRYLEGSRLNLAELAWAFVRHGEAKLNKALSGQYDFPEGIYFGGHEVQPEAAAIQNLVLEIAEPYKNMAIIDMHTGLGKFGVNQIMRNSLAADASPEVQAAYEREAELLKDMFPADECEGLCEVPGLTETSDGDGINEAFTTTGDFTQWFQERFAEKRVAGTVISVTSEVGTVAARKVLQGLVNENYCHHHRDACGDKQHAADVEKLRELFNPRDRAWQEQVVRGAYQMCGALGRFSYQR